MVGHPGMAGAKMALDAQLRPISQHLCNTVRRGLWLQAERVSAQVDPFRAIAVSGYVEEITKFGQGIVRVHGRSELLALFVTNRGQSSSSAVNFVRINSSAFCQSTCSTLSIPWQSSAS